MTDQTPWDDSLFGFHLSGGLTRGRVARLGHTLDEVLARHAEQPEPVRRLLAETALLAVALAGGLKYEGVFTFQVSADGPVHTLMADVTSTGDLRAVCRVERERLADAVAVVEQGGDQPRALLGRGHVAFTVDQGPRTERYQGITELTAGPLSVAVEHYFAQSEQLATRVRAAAAPGPDGTWRGGCLLIQRMPPESGGRNDTAANDAWETAGVLLDTLEAAELLDPGLTPARLAHRLFHGESLVPGETRPLRFGCRCSREKLAAVLARYPRAELDRLKQDDGLVSASCQFCGAHYTFGDADLDDLAAHGT